MTPTLTPTPTSPVRRRMQAALKEGKKVEGEVMAAAFRDYSMAEEKWVPVPRGGGEREGECESTVEGGGGGGGCTFWGA